jgi:hypothetical protein
MEPLKRAQVALNSGILGMTYLSVGTAISKKASDHRSGGRSQPHQQTLLKNGPIGTHDQPGWLKNHVGYSTGVI